MRRAALQACSRALQSGSGSTAADVQLAERLLSSSLAGPSQGPQAVNTLFSTLQRDPQAARCFVRAFSAVAGRAPPASGVAGVQHGYRAASRYFQQVRHLLCFPLPCVATARLPCERYRRLACSAQAESTCMRSLRRSFASEGPKNGALSSSPCASNVHISPVR